jgi:hypothetical protein
MRRSLLAALSLLVASLPLGISHASDSVRVGYGAADASWHVGSGSGQYSEKDPNALGLATGTETDPFNHGLTQRHSYGVQSRLSYRTIVVEGTNGKRIAFVKSDSYLAQDALTRRVSQILDANGTSGVHYDDIMLMASHNHSSPYYTSPSWGVWLFQDAFDIRAFEYSARQMALSIENAAKTLQPARMGATTIKHTIYKGNIAGATLGDDGSPAGYPDTHADFGLTVVRFDALASGSPIATLVSFGEHPESNDDYDLITADFLAPLQRMVERDTGAPLVWGQSDVGSSEGPYFRDGYEMVDSPDGKVVRAWAHVGHAQTERGARFLADDIVKAFGQIGRDEGLVKNSSDFTVAAGRAFVPGPVSHPYPSVSNCRTHPTLAGNPGSPILGLPDCERAGQLAPDSGVYGHLKESGVPVPENYDAGSFSSVQENLRIHLQAFRMGEVLFASCACEAQMDLILNFESRADKTQGNLFNGFNYPCTQNIATNKWDCKYGKYLQQTVTIGNAEHDRMVAQINNDAKGWDDPAYASQANAEPLDPTQIKGNFTHEELDSNLGYLLPVGVGHAGDYNGYVVSYREYMIRDHYRKALTAYGLHTADYMVTRMVRLAASLREGGPAMPPEPLDALAEADEVRETAFAAALGRASAIAYDGWLAGLPNDVGPADIVAQPKDITRFNAATFSWHGGSNAVDNPIVRVEKEVGDSWLPFADQTGEVQTMVKFPVGADGVAGTYAGNTAWEWTANFEAFDSFPRATVAGGQTPSGTYRFVVDGAIRQAGANQAYHLESAPFQVTPWTGVKAFGLNVENDGSTSLQTLDFYPRTYSGSPFRFIKDDGNAVLCKTCSFRPWASQGTVESVTVHVKRAGGGVVNVPAAFSNGKWVAATALGTGDVATVLPGGIVDSFGEINGETYTF